MKKHHSVQGTFSRLFGKKHGTAAASLFATNPPWIFSQEVTSDSAGGTGQCSSSSVLPGGGKLGEGRPGALRGGGKGCPVPISSPRCGRAALCPAFFSSPLPKTVLRSAVIEGGAVCVSFGCNRNAAPWGLREEGRRG